ncbi:sce7726 family protein [Sporomusa sphaeroides]|uniref:sce7726 family protein n=1 Tax=Sporomusa sphaeroides TaxID=47679 RepID=UPI003DA06B87
MLLRDIDIREALRDELSVQFTNSHSIIVDELRICWGDTRVDIAVVNCSLHGYEIKSDRDTLERLPRQAELYNKIFDTVTIVCSQRWVEKVKDKIPDWWGILIPRIDENDQSTINFERERQALHNPHVDLRSLVELTWKDEALAILAKHGLDRGVRSKPRWDIWDRMVDKMDPEELKYAVRECLKSRQGWRTPDSLRRLGVDLRQ